MKYTKILDSLANRHGIHNVFEDFLDVAIYQLTFIPANEHFDEFNQEIKMNLDRMKKGYGDEGLVDLTQAFRSMMLEMQEHTAQGEKWVDLIGPFYEEISSRYKSSAMGQFFTPASLCDMIAQMIGGKNMKPGQTVLEPAAGTGRMILAMNACCLGLRYTAIDKDPLCARMTALNMTIHGLIGVVYCMDTLAMDTPSRKWVINAHLFKTGIPSIIQVKPEKMHEETLETIRPSTQSNQLTLF